MTQYSSKSAQLANDIREIYSRAKPEGTDRAAIARQELEALFRVQLGSDYDSAKINSVAALQHSWRAKQLALSEQLERREIDFDTFRQGLRTLTAEMASQCEKVLGANDFERLFGVAAKDASDLFSVG